jgi:hypothetical protein
MRHVSAAQKPYARAAKPAGKAAPLEHARGRELSAGMPQRLRIQVHRRKACKRVGDIPSALCQSEHAGLPCWREPSFLRGLVAL